MNKSLRLSLFLSLCFFGGLLAQTSYTYTGKPQFQILTKRGGNVLGKIKIELFPDIAPHHVRNFDSLVSVQFYDTTAFHRVVPGFVIQGGDPNSRHGAISTWGFGQAGQPTVNAEFGFLKHTRGILSAARSQNINSATSQFFICVAAASNLNGLYSAYGRVISGMGCVDTIVGAPCMASPYASMPAQKIEMFVTYLGSNDSILPAPVLITPTKGTDNVDTLTVLQLKWNAVPGALFYHLDVSTDSLFVNDTIRSVDASNLLYNLNQLKSNTKYFWRIKVTNGGNRTYSPIWNFRTKGPETAGINSISGARTGIDIFPNPSFGKFTFSNLERGEVIEVFDINGKPVYSAEAKETTVNVELDGRAKGIYFYRVSNDKHSKQEGKLILR